MHIDFEAELWVWEARPTETWTLVTLPEAESDEIMDRAAGPKRGFGAVRVEATVGAHTWRTSIFPDKTKGAYVLPIKKAVRKSADLKVGDRFPVHVKVIEAEGEPPTKRE